ncbi:hypothetical protein IWX84_001482 [Flavobacterium sp. CG_9.10]|uniref:hypothetical protein n=1 Tax=Flavobacterium sp. CG_9.10 TaxID=2787729 RepID=UPI0018CB7CC2|nr:hypothetical protein [Flavobacterium sp. CG_9.10]MBG6110603.1 hypothetical protein [Flavobacterium sp. CG_9.10]
MTEENYGLVVEIHSVVQNDNKDFMFYFIIDNTTNQAKEIKLNGVNYLTNKREEINPDRYYQFSGGFFRIDEPLKIAPNTLKKIGIKFENQYLKKILNNDKIYFPLELTTEGVNVTFCFHKTENGWLLIDIGVVAKEYDVDIKLTPIQRKQIEKRLINRIERLEAFEERLGVSIQNLSVSYNYDYGNSFVFFELHSNEGSTIKDRITVECIYYGIDGSIIYQNDNTVSPADFFGFEVISFRVQDEFLDQISKIRLYPKK